MFLCPDVFPYDNPETCQLHLLQETEGSKEQSTESQIPSHSSSNLLFPLSSPPRNHISWSSHPYLHSSGLSVLFFWIILLVFFCRGKELLRECQISTTTVCCPCSSFNSLQSTEDFLVKKCYTTRFISCAVFPGQVGKGFVRGLHTLPYFILKEK